MRHLVLLLLTSALPQLLAAQTASQNYILSRRPLNTSGTAAIETVTYVDGLGRPVETVQKGAAPDGGDIVSMKEYDGLDREVRSWLPVPVGKGGGGYVSPQAFRSSAVGSDIYGGDVSPYSENVYEQSVGYDMYDNGARWSNSILGRWETMDKLAEKSYDDSPYVASGNNPMRFLDDDGFIKKNYFRILKTGDYKLSEKDVVSEAYFNQFKDDKENVIAISSHGFHDGFVAPYYENAECKLRGIKSADDFYNLIKNDKGMWMTFEKSQSKGLRIVLYMCNTASFAKDVSKDSRFKDVEIIAPNGTLSVQASDVNNGGENVEDYNYANFSISIKSPNNPSMHGVWKAYKNGVNVANYVDSSTPGADGYDYTKNRPSNMVNGLKYKK